MAQNYRQTCQLSCLSLFIKLIWQNPCLGFIQFPPAPGLHPGSCRRLENPLDHAWWLIWDSWPLNSNGPFVLSPVPLHSLVHPPSQPLAWHITLLRTPASQTPHSYLTAEVWASYFTEKIGAIGELPQFPHHFSKLTSICPINSAFAPLTVVEPDFLIKSQYLYFSTEPVPSQPIQGQNSRQCLLSYLNNLCFSTGSLLSAHNHAVTPILENKLKWTSTNFCLVLTSLFNICSTYLLLVV